jgi:hypothetical protein
VVREYNAEAHAAALATRRAEVAAEARARLAGRPAEARERFERLLSRAERAYPVREEHGFFDGSTPIALARYAYLEAGGRLVDRSLIARKTETFFLEADEVEAVLQEGQSYKQLVERRKGERAWVLANPGPASYGKRPPQPSYAGLPPESRRSHEAVRWTIERSFAPAASNRKQTDASALSGIAASAGEYTGPGDPGRDRVWQDPARRCPGLSHYVTGLVDPLRQCRRPGDRYGGHPFPLGDHRPGVSGSGGCGDRECD